MRMKIVTRESLLNHIKKHREEFKKIILAGGCFDLFHPGHLEYIEEAKSLNGIVIVGINSDDSVIKVKGESPLYPFEERANMLAALEYVDYVVRIDELNLNKIISLIRPDFFVKGIDYKGKDFPEQEVAKEVGTKILLLGEKKRYSSTPLKKKYRGELYDITKSRLYL
ncbi:adenylyltransferase/cytidyltransferase family protein [Bacillus sp. SM2101]|uniref:adenylyltransferase/cytidyltransferase family protein n=1 Tax=Bacillus sp. SM2101 TaxID=2805366 RepID=UPI001BDEB4E5|nr:adenylyltransferase/cytidyltransferase family protein [Bacillus sp. SM2101]